MVAATMRESPDLPEEEVIDECGSRKDRDAPGAGACGDH